MAVENVKKTLFNSIKTLTAEKWLFSRDPERDNVVYIVQY